MVHEKLCRMKDLFRRMYAFEAELQKEWGLSLNEAMALCTLSGGTRNAGEVAAEVGLSESRMSRVLGSLESKGFIHRDVSHDDKRVMLFSLTPAGREKLDGIQAAGMPFGFCDEAGVGTDAADERSASDQG
ncbi:MAG: winged helix DNA-binding protein [Acidobacteria bacterium]|nr:winged helix DNA-binding protein [Acidobacteriota bacterium]